MTQLEGFAREFSTAAEWRDRAERVTQGIMQGMRFTPPKKTPLRPIIHSKRKFDGYSVENAAFESLPGFFVTGNLYRPAASTEARNVYAGILCPHGHFGGGRFREEMQLRCAAFARMGAVVFAYDMIGWGDSNQMDHSDTYVMTLQTWNSIRIVDFLCSLPEVDPARIGVTGASGGGTQSFLLAAIDQRVRVSIPVAMVSAHTNGGCNCEIGLPIHKGTSHETNNADIAALAAPRPQLLISITWRGMGADWSDGPFPVDGRQKDQSCNTPKVEFPYLQRVYGLLGAKENVENLHLADEGHNYGYSKRVGAYSFFAKHIDLDLASVQDDNQRVDESFVRILEEDELRVWDDTHPRPGHALQGAAAIEAEFWGYQAQTHGGSRLA